MSKAFNIQSMWRKAFLCGGMMAAMFFVLLYGVQNADAAIVGQLDFGSSGTDVVELQTYFATDISIYPSGLVTGYFDSLTQAATQKFQAAQGIVFRGTPSTTGYGRVGPRTLKRLNALIYLIPMGSIQGSSALLVENTAASSTQEQTSFGLPMRLLIPRIDVDASFQYVGLTPDGAMDMIKSLKDVAWFGLGPRPGEDDSAVIGGHYDGRENGKASVFDNLHKLRKGDKIYIEDNKGMVITFVVRETRSYDPNADASDVFGSNDGNSHLNLITCDGDWNKVTKSYSKRLVVFADKV